MLQHVTIIQVLQIVTILVFATGCETCSEDGLSVIDNDSDDDGVCDATR